MSIDRISIQYVKGVGPAKKKLFAKLGIETIGDLFYLFPRRYEDRRQMTRIRDVKPGSNQTVLARVLDNQARRTWYTKKHVYEVLVGDQTGRMTCVWFNQPYLAHYFKPGKDVVFYGKVDIYKNRLQMVAPEYEILDAEKDSLLNTGRIVPVYPLTRGMTQRYLRKVVYEALGAYEEQLEDIMPVSLRNKHRLFNIRHSIKALHFPDSAGDWEEALRRLSFEEFLLFQLSVRKRRLQIVGRPGYQHHIDSRLVHNFISSFPFTLTNAQRRVINEIAGDMQRDFPMLRLLQGDVGCGKTLVSLFGCVAAAVNGFQSAIMVPTEVLAVQHYENILRIKGLEDYGGRRLKNGPSIPACPAGRLQSFNPVLLTGSLPARRKEEVLAAITSGEADIVIGTHALLTEDVRFKELSFVVIDEQHKFGVRQRALLSAKGKNPDVLVMTATPIPRSLSLTLFGDLDISVIDEMPARRGKVTTKIYPLEQDEDVYEKVRGLLASGQQAFVVYPVIQESEKLDLKAAEEMHAMFVQKTFKDYRIGLAHGQMKRSELDGAMRRFREHEIDVLVATTVLEVGVDVPDASVMVIEHAERFGISQLHQLRGRIGRGERDAHCFLLCEPTTEESMRRLEAVASTANGFVLAEKDLEIRGPGHYFGRHQHGMNELRFVNPLKQVDILETARAEAEEIIQADPDLRDPAHEILLKTICQRYPGYLEHIEAG
ncbi:MAG: ATP-dependent DNA helicase RecG [Candidatus Omnitrophota bacterium]